MHNTLKKVIKADGTLQLAVLAGDFLLSRAFSAAVSLDNIEV
jgi:geranylgeranyl pyrophosphate synthase